MFETDSLQTNQHSSSPWLLLGFDCREVIDTPRNIRFPDSCRGIPLESESPSIDRIDKSQ
jgi:hypothetical protein